MTRRHGRRDGTHHPEQQVLAPDQRLTIKEALRAHMVTSAYALFQEKIKGSLEPGKMADLIV